MKITMTNFALLELIQTLNRFANVTGKLGWAISRTKKRMEDEMAIFEGERNKLIMKYGEQDAQGNYTVDQNGEKYSDFAREVSEIASEQVEIEFSQVPKEVFDAADYYNEQCSVRDYDILEALFVENPTDKDEKAV